MTKYIFLFCLAVGLLSVALLQKRLIHQPLFTHLVVKEKQPLWAFRSIDTMKYSRDTSRAKLNDPSFDTVIDQQVHAIALTGASHVAIATPYDEEFVPFLKRWVAAARKYHLNVWFRGNWSGWEKWFDYPAIDRATHIAKTKDFILKHPDLFANGDVFTACPECENGGPGDPRQTGDVSGYREFLIAEYKVTKQAFQDIHKNVLSNYDSMNADVARLIMNKPTTKALDGIVTIDHYVASPEKLASDIQAIGKASGGKVILGEFGAPIPDIHGQMTEAEQALWLDEVFTALSKVPDAAGMNYWVSVGGTTELWHDNGTATSAVKTITMWYSKKI